MLKILLLIVSCALIILVSVQPGKTNGLANSISGVSNLSLFANRKERGIEKTLTTVTAVCVALFLLISFFGKVVG